MIQELDVALRIAMLGTGSFALPTFLGLLDSPHTVVGLVTQPDRTGAGHHQHRNPLKEAALARGLPVFQPVKASAPEALATLAAWPADLFVVAAYGQILSRQFLDLPRLGAINVHASILPKYRGASPIQHAIWHGESETGVTVFQIVKELDAGPILSIARTPIRPDETSGELECRLAELAVPNLLDVINQLANGTARPQSQDDSQATYARRLSKADGQIDWNRSAAAIACQVRAMQPWPKAFCTWQRPNGPPLRLILLRVSARSNPDASAHPPGTIVDVQQGQLIVQTGCQQLSIESLQPAGKRAMDAADFLRGNPVEFGQCLASPDQPAA